MSKIISVIAAMILYGTMLGCNTMEGAGKDVQKGGEKIQDAAKDTKKNM